MEAPDNIFPVWSSTPSSAAITLLFLVPGTPQSTKMLVVDIDKSNLKQERFCKAPCSPKCETACSAASPAHESCWG